MIDSAPDSRAILRHRSATLQSPACEALNRCIVRYIGNAWNLPAASVCFDPNQSVLVFPSLFKNGFE